MTHFSGDTVVFNAKEIGVLHRMITAAVTYAGTSPVFDGPTARRIRTTLQNARNAQQHQELRTSRTENSGDHQESLSTAEVAHILGITERAVQAKAQHLGGRKIKGQWSFDPEDIHAYLEEL